MLMLLKKIGLYFPPLPCIFLGDYHEMTHLITLKATIWVITTFSWVVSSTSSVSGSLVILLCHTTLRLSTPSSKIFGTLIPAIILFSWCRCTSWWWDRSRWTMLKRWLIPIFDLLLDTFMTCCVDPLIAKLFSVLLLIFLNLFLQES